MTISRQGSSKVEDSGGLCAEHSVLRGGAAPQCWCDRGQRHLPALAPSPAAAAWGAARANTTIQESVNIREVLPRLLLSGCLLHRLLAIADGCTLLIVTRPGAETAMGTLSAMHSMGCGLFVLGSVNKATERGC